MITAANVTADQLDLATAQPDSEWSDPGTTSGTPDRYQARWLAGCHLSAGNNWRGPNGRHLRHDAPWSVTVRLRCSVAVHAGQVTSLEVGAGSCATQAEARAAAEMAARTFAAELAARSLAGAA